MRDIDDHWNDIAGSVQPLAYTLKFELAQRWVRFHSLPESRRYPDSDADMRAVIDRHNEILSAVFTLDEKLYFVVPAWAEESSIKAQAKGYIHWRDVLADEDDPESNNRLHVKTAAWSVGCLDWAISASANDDLHGFMAIGAGSRVLYHPYDGGMDLILPSALERARLQCEFAQYLSSHPAGL